jgi:hypothetical protein
VAALERRRSDPVAAASGRHAAGSDHNPDFEQMRKSYTTGDQSDTREVGTLGPQQWREFQQFRLEFLR